MILISYPSGGFGNFIYYVLTEIASNTYKFKNSNFEFDLLGRSHAVAKYTPTYFHDPDSYCAKLPDTDREILILCDNGINNDSYAKINQTFPEALKIRTCIDLAVRPVIYKTCIYKAAESDPLSETHNQVVNNWIDHQEPYAIRENFTLMYHNWPFKWEPASDCVNVSLESLIDDPKLTITNLIHSIGGEVIDANRLTIICDNWLAANQKYFTVYYEWADIESALHQNYDLNISHITDLHDQGYINYCIESKFNVIIPVYDYRDWFNSTNDIKEMIKCLK